MVIQGQLKGSPAVLFSQASPFPRNQTNNTDIKNSSAIHGQKRRTQVPTQVPTHHTYMHALTVGGHGPLGLLPSRPGGGEGVRGSSNAGTGRGLGGGSDCGSRLSCLSFVCDAGHVRSMIDARYSVLCFALALLCFTLFCRSFPHSEWP